MPRYLTPLLVAVVAASLIACDSNEAGPTTTPTPGDAADLEAFETLEEVAQRTALLLDLDRGSGPEISLIDDDDLVEIVAELLADPEVIASLRRDEAFYALFGLIPPGTDLLALNDELLVSGIAGLYRPETDHLYVRLFGRFSALEEATASHEYAHYLQDRHYDLETLFDIVVGDRDAELALRALIEGDAQFIQQQYVDEYFSSVQVFGMTFGGVVAAAEGQAAPYAFIRETTFVYLDGQAWIDELLSRGYERAEIYASPPLTTREVLSAAAYIDQLERERVDVPFDVAADALPSDWTIGDRETIGQLLLTIWLEDLGASGVEANRAGDGWIADGLRVFRRKDEPIAFIARVEWETADESDEFIEIATQALQRDARYQRADCQFCDGGMWTGPSGVFAFLSSSEGALLIAVR